LTNENPRLITAGFRFWFAAFVEFPAAAHEGEAVPLDLMLVVDEPGRAARLPMRPDIERLIVRSDGWA
jgi:hypothetical protein